MELEKIALPTRLPRFVRHRHGKPPFQLQPRDIEIIRIVADHRVIASDDIRLLVGGSAQMVTRRLQRLFHHGFLDRPRVQRVVGNTPIVYALGERGADLVAAQTGRRPFGVWAEKNRTIGLQFIEHALMINRFQTALRHAATTSGSVLVERWCPDGFVRDAAVVRTDTSAERVPIVPDAFVILNVLSGAKPGRVHVFLEADRGTMTVPRFTTKLHGYVAYWQSGIAADRWGMKNFLVVTTTRTPERAASLMRAATNIDASRMLLFVAETEYLPATSCQILQAIWRTPNGERHSIVE